MNLTILDKMFPNTQIPETYWEGVDMIGEAVKCEEKDIANASLYWEKAGYFFLGTNMKDWGNHMLKYSIALDNHQVRLSSQTRSIRTKSFPCLKMPSKMKKLLEGWNW